MSVSIKRTDSNDKDFRQLIVELDIDLEIRNGEEQSFYAQFNGVDKINFVVVAYQDSAPVGCGAIKEYDADTMEIKRMFVSTGHRKLGMASAILKELEIWALELGFHRCILESGVRQIEAIALYHKRGYHIFPNFGQYENMTNSLCFEKPLTPNK